MRYMNSISFHRPPLEEYEEISSIALVFFIEFYELNFCNDGVWGLNIQKVENQSNVLNINLLFLNITASKFVIAIIHCIKFNKNLYESDRISSYSPIL